MRSLKSIAILLLTNLLFVLVITAALAAFHLHLSLAIFALVFGFGAAFFSLFFSKFLVKRIYHMQAVPHTHPLHRLMAETAGRANLPLPELWLYEDARPNAFATGPTRRRAMIAVSTGLLSVMDGDTLHAVFGHEMGHVANGDMLSTTLLTGLMNAYVIWLGNLVGRYFGNNPITRFAVTIVAEIGLSTLALIPICAFSRHREYAADAFSASLWGPQPMMDALHRLQQIPVITNPRRDHLATAYIHGSFRGLFATHPSTQKRIARLASIRQILPDC